MASSVSLVGRLPTIVVAVAAQADYPTRAGCCIATIRRCCSTAWAGGRDVAALPDGLDAHQRPGSCSEAAGPQPEREPPVQRLCRWV